MKRIVKWLGIAVVVLVVAVGAVVAIAWWQSERALARVYEVDDPPLVLAADVATLEHGRHLWLTRGCGDCHTENGAGEVMLDIPPLLVAPSNLTPARLAERGYDADAIAAAVRHGVRPDGTPLVFMPSSEYSELGDADMAALVSYMATLPDVAEVPPPTRPRLLGRVLYLFGALPMLPAEHIDHAPRERAIPAVAETAAYGAYVASICTGCHGTDFSGGRVMKPGSPPSANLTPHAAGLAGWTREDFVRAVREGVRPDGSKLDEMMPITATARMTDTELGAMWAYLSTLPPRPTPR